MDTYAERMYKKASRLEDENIKLRQENAELKDKVSRRNMQIKDLKSKFMAICACKFTNTASYHEALKEISLIVNQ